MAEKLVWSYDLRKMTSLELWSTSLTYPVVSLYALLALVSGAYALFSAKSWVDIVWPVVAVLFIYPFVWYDRWLHKMRWGTALWKRIHFDFHQDPHKQGVLLGSPANTISTMTVIAGPISYLISGWSGVAAAFSMTIITICGYEFFYGIQHLRSKSKNRSVQKPKREHLLHHFHNEAASIGIFSFLPDTAFS